MNDNREVRDFLAKLHKFLPDRVIYEALSVLPEDIFDFSDYIRIPFLKNDDDVQAFINMHNFENPDNIISFFMEQYIADIDRIIDEVLDNTETTEDSFFYNIDYDLVFAG